jgi:tetratricopeptide (TPR) repeat protein
MRAVAFRAVVLALAVLLGGLAHGARATEEPKPEAGKGGTRRPPAVDPNTGKRLNEAVEHMHAQRYGEARAALGKLNLERLSPYELSRAEQLLAAVDQAESHYGAARDHLNKALASGGLNDEEASSTRFQLAQLFMAEDKWREGIEALKQWFATTQNPNSAAYHLLAVAYYQLGDYASALEPAQKAIDLSGGHPQESWLQLLLALRLQRQEYAAAVPILKQLVEAAPTKKSYWLQLSAVNAQLGSYADAVVPLELAYHAGLLTEEQDLEHLAQLLVQVTVPYRAGQILSQAIEQGKVKGDLKSYELLTNCWVAAREYEKATQPLRRAADLSDNGELYVRLGEVYIQRQEWGNAAEALRLALQKGKLKNPGNAQLLIGLSLYNQKKLEDARSWFERAREHAESRAQAEGWLRAIDGKLESGSTTEKVASTRAETP